MSAIEEGFPKWLEYSLISSLLCILGGVLVPAIAFCFKTKKDLNSKLVNYGLSLSAGSMMTTALYKMLPNDNTKGADPLSIFGGLAFGMGLSLILNYIVHACASESLMHCAHDANGGEESSVVESHDHFSNRNSHSNSHGHSHSHSEGNDDSHNQCRNHEGAVGHEADEHTHLVDDAHHDRPHNVQKKSSLLDLFSPTNAEQMGDCKDITSCAPMVDQEAFSCVPSGIASKHKGMFSSSDESNEPLSVNENGEAVGVACLENEIGYDLENLALYRKNFHKNRKLSHSHEHRHSTSHSDSDHHGYGTGVSLEQLEELEHQSPDHAHHHHHLETPFSKLLSIGLQTCVVITLHKFPEGFIIFYTNQSKNVSKELGFSIFLSLTIHNFVEGFSMTLPFYAAFENKFIAILITTFLGGFSQPLGALIGYLIFKDKHNGDDTQLHMDAYLSVTAGFLLVIGLQMFQTAVGFSQSHHHHQGEADEELKENHSSGATCLKWCCVGVLLIVSSGVLK